MANPLQEVCIIRLDKTTLVKYLLVNAKAIEMPDDM